MLWGRIYKFYSTKIVAMLSILIFEVGSALCGAAPSSVTFIVGRAIAGLASASMFSGTTVIITQIIPLHKRPVYMAMLGMVFGVSCVIGPLLGRKSQWATTVKKSGLTGRIRRGVHGPCILAVVLLYQVSRMAHGRSERETDVDISLASRLVVLRSRSWRTIYTSRNRNRSLRCGSR